MEPSVRRKASWRNPPPNSDRRGARRSATPRKLPRKVVRRAERRSKKKRRSPVWRTSLGLLRIPLDLVLPPHILLTKLAAFAFHQFSQIVEQSLVPRAEDFYQEREGQRGGRTRVQQLAK